MNRKQYLLLVALTIAAGLIGGAASNWMFMARSAAAQAAPMVESVIKAEAFWVVDDKGNLRSSWGLDSEGNPVLAFFDESKKARTLIHVAGLLTSDEHGKACMLITAGGLSVVDKDENARIYLALDSDGACLLLLDEHGTSRAALGSVVTEVIATGGTRIRAESSLVLFNKDGKVMWSAP